MTLEAVVGQDRSDVAVEFDCWLLLCRGCGDKARQPELDAAEQAQLHKAESLAKADLHHYSVNRTRLSCKEATSQPTRWKREACDAFCKGLR